ncbi:MAG TPA: DUF1854 domain-containing protein [Armatimonadota bacterium]|nr:DUF1854 domain-containing protein [Armatimonadota bacterium]
MSSSEAEAVMPRAKAEPVELKYLEPSKITLIPRGQARPDMTIEGDRSYLAVGVRRAFPRSLKNEYIAFYDCKDTEIGMLRNLKGLSKEAGKVIAEELDRRYFTPSITAIHRIKEEYGIAQFDVETTRGRTRFGVRSVRENITELETGMVKITDLHGTVYEIPNVNDLDPASRARLYEII